MSIDRIWEEFTGTIRRELELPADYGIQPEATAEEVPGWDSMAWLTIVNALQDRFAVQLDLDRIAEARTVGELAGLVAERLDGDSA